MDNFFSSSDDTSFPITDQHVSHLRKRIDWTSPENQRQYVWQYRPRTIPLDVWQSQYRVDACRLILRSGFKSQSAAADKLAGISAFIVWCRDQHSFTGNESLRELLTYETIEDYADWAQRSGSLSGQSPAIRRWMLRRLLAGETVGAHDALSGLEHPGSKAPKRVADIADLEALVASVMRENEAVWAATLASMFAGSVSLPYTDVLVGDLSEVRLPPRFTVMSKQLSTIFDETTIVSRNHWHTLIKRFAPHGRLTARSIWQLRQTDWLESQIPTAVVAFAGVGPKKLPSKDRLFKNFGDPARFADVLSALPPAP